MKKIYHQQFALFLFNIIFIIFTLDYVFAQSPSKPITLETIVITAKQSSTPFQTGDVDLEETPGFVSVITREQFEGKMEDISEVIEKEAGIQVRQSGGLGSFSSVSLRGSSSEQVMVFMDGMLLNDASGGGVDLSNISLSDVEEIEIYRGAAPINFGKTSIGGVVNIKTQRAKKGLNANVSAGYGSFDTKRGSAFINHKPGKLDYLISADALHSDNNFEFINDNGTEWNKDDDRKEKRNNAQIDENNVLAKCGYDFTNTFRVDLINQWFEKNQGLPNWNNSEKIKTTFDTERNITTLKITADDIGSLHFNTSTSFDYLWKEEEYDDSQGYVGLGKQHSIYNTKRYGAHFFLEWLTEINSFSLMLDAQKEEYDPEDLLNNQNPNKSYRETYAMGLQDSLVLFENRLTVTPAIRYTLIKDELKSAISTWGIPMQEISQDEDYISSQIGMKYRLIDWLVLKTNIAKYTREPSFFELFGDRGFFLGNMDLKAEEGINFDAGFEISHIISNQWLSRISCSIAYFQSDVDDLITRVYDARGIGKSDNISKAIIKGIETGVKIDFLKYFRLITNVTWQDTENDNEVKAFDGKKLPGRFETSYMTRLEAKYKKIKLYSEYIKEQGLYYDTANLLEADDKEEINMGISWLYRSVTLNFDAKNIQDNQYEDFNGYPLPGQSYSFTIKYNF